MTATDFIKLLQKPGAVTERQTTELEVILSEFPYFQSAVAIRLKGLHNQNSFRYNLELKKAAAQTTDRTVLFDFITSEHFGAKETDIHQIEVFDTEIVSEKWITPEEKLEQSLMTSIKSAEVETKSNKLVQKKGSEEEITGAVQLKENPQIDKPVKFAASDKFSFDQWLQLTKAQPIVREQIVEQVKEQEEVKVEEKSEINQGKLKKLELIDKFIQTNPKIIPDKNAPVISVIEAQSYDSSTLMTETLAKVYLEQKKYQKAIDAYEILILKYPEKSVFFADRIENIKKLQQNNI